YLVAARVIPYRGSWLDFEFDAKDIVNVRIDRKRKLPVTALLHALDMGSEEILNTFYDRVTFVRGKNGWAIPYVTENWRGQKPTFDVVNGDTGEVVFAAGTKITPRAANKAAKDGLQNLVIPTEEIFGRYSAYDLVNDSTGEIYIEAGDEVSPENLDKLDRAGIDRIEPLELDVEDTVTTLRKEDIIAVVKTLVDLKDGKGEIDDIDNLGNRRVRSVGELLENQYRVGLLRMERAVKERMSSVDVSTVMPNDLINAKPAVAAVREFFGSSQLS